MVYEWKTLGYKTKPSVAAEVFKELEETVGLTPKNLVNASRDENAPLHNEFEWNDEIAGEKWREQQGRLMICNLSVRVEEAPPVRAYISLTTNERKYESIGVILSDRDKTRLMMDNALKELNAFKCKYRNIKEFAQLFAEIDKLQDVREEA